MMNEEESEALSINQFKKKSINHSAILMTKKKRVSLNKIIALWLGWDLVRVVWPKQFVYILYIQGRLPTACNNKFTVSILWVASYCKFSFEAPFVYRNSTHYKLAIWNSNEPIAVLNTYHNPKIPFLVLLSVHSVVQIIPLAFLDRGIPSQCGHPFHNCSKLFRFGASCSHPQCDQTFHSWNNVWMIVSRY